MSSIHFISLFFGSSFTIISIPKHDQSSLEKLIYTTLSQNSFPPKLSFKRSSLSILNIRFIHFLLGSCPFFFLPLKLVWLRFVLTSITERRRWRIIWSSAMESYQNVWRELFGIWIRRKKNNVGELLCVPRPLALNTNMFHQLPRREQNHKKWLFIWWIHQVSTDENEKGEKI